MKRFNNIKVGFVAVLLMVAALGADAQQDPHFTQYFFNPLAINSGYAGSRDALNITLLAREQWVGTDGRPRTQTLAAHTPLRNDKIAVGFTMVNDRIGPVKATSFSGDVAYRLQVNKDARLAFGLKAGVNMFQAGLSSLRGAEGDVLFAQDITSKALPNFGFSMYYWSDRYFVGASAPKLIKNNVSSDAMAGTEAYLKQHVFVNGGYVFDLAKNIRLKPTAMLKFVQGGPVSIDLTANVLLNDQLWVGAMYRVKDAFGLLASYQINQQLRVGYSYDYTLTELDSYNTGSHELMISYDFNFTKDQLLSPRFF